ncbi:hypothetical protein SEVIR_4G237301v4 [Setaria viridis]
MPRQRQPKQSNWLWRFAASLLLAPCKATSRWSDSDRSCTYSDTYVRPGSKVAGLDQGNFPSPNQGVLRRVGRASFLCTGSPAHGIWCPIEYVPCEKAEVLCRTRTAVFGAVNKAVARGKPQRMRTGGDGIRRRRADAPTIDLMTPESEPGARAAPAAGPRRATTPRNGQTPASRRCLPTALHPSSGQARLAVDGWARPGTPGNAREDALEAAVDRRGREEVEGHN